MQRPTLVDQSCSRTFTALVCSLDRRKQSVERFGQRRVGEDGIPKSRIRHLAEHGYLDHGGYLTAFYSQNRTAQDLMLIGVHHGLHQASTLVHLQRPRHIAHWHLGNANVKTLLTGLPFTEAHTAQLRVDK